MAHGREYFRDVANRGIPLASAGGLLRTSPRIGIFNWGGISRTRRPVDIKLGPFTSGGRLKILGGISYCTNPTFGSGTEPELSEIGPN